ncbi:hypothetical protein V2J09_023780 [Rumex salicifolius]
MEGFAVNTIVASTISWTTLFLLTRNILRSRSFEFCNRIVSTVHAALAVILASLSVHDWNCPVCPLASQSSPNQARSSIELSDLFSKMQMKIIAISLGYFIYDMICSQFDVRPNLENSIHHLVCIIGLGAGLVYQKGGSEMVAALWITELSSPFLHFRELLKELGYKDTDLNLAADVAFAAIFSIARMVGGPYLTYVTISATNPFLIKAMALGLQLVCTFWFYKIARMILYKFTKRASARKKTI